jgi:chloramphenicol-sensitive protein RarD
MQQHHEQAKGVAVAFVTYGLWGLLTLYWKQLEDFDPFELIGWRVATAAAVMVLLLTLTRGWGGVVAVARDRRQLAVVTIAALFLTVNWTAYVWAVVHDDVLETALGYFIAPLGTVTVGVLVLHEPLRAAQKAALALAGAAVVVLAVSYGRVPWLALVIAASWTTYGYLKKQVPLTPVHSMAAESLVLLVPAAVAIAALAGRADSIPRSADGPHLTLALLTGVATVVPLMMFAYAAPRVPLTIIGPMQYLVPSINFTIGWVIYDEPMPGARLAGFALVWAGLVLLTAEAALRSRRTRISPAG